MRKTKSQVEKMSDAELTEFLSYGRQQMGLIKNEIRKVVFGEEMEHLIDVLLVALLTNSHVLVRADIGLGKTLTCNAFARTLGGVARKVQFRPDMMPQDISGKPMYNMRTGKEEIFHGPVVGTNVLVADEINRATPKAQAALLEAMEEKQVTIGKHLFSLEKVFIVLATRNPIERDGTYDLPEAQLDRFGFQPHIESWSPETGMTMLADPKYYLDVSDRLGQVQKVISLSEIINLREAIFKKFYVEPRLDRYIVDLCLATHNDESVEHGSSPRGAIMLKKAATVAAFLEGRGYDGTRKYFEKLNVVIPGFNFVVPEDVRTYAVDVLAHRIFLFPKARYDDKKITPAGVIEKVLREVEEPRQI